MNCSQALEYDGDIAGTGVRLSFYIQDFILVLLLKRSHEDTENALWTFIATSFGLTVASLVQLGSLTLLDGILVSQLSWFANLGTFLALASYSRSKGEDRIVKLAAVLQGYFSMILTVVMWTYDNKFPASDCSSLKYVVLFGVEVPAFRTGRVVALVFASLMMLVYTVLTLIECHAWRKHGKSHMSVREPDLEMAARRTHRPRRRNEAHIARHNRSNANIHERHSFRQQWLGTHVDPIFFGIILSQVIVFAYFVSTTELIIRRSHAVQDASTGRWGFGQVFALTVVIPSGVALWRALRKKLAERKSKVTDEVRSPRLRGSPNEGMSPRTDRSGSLSTPHLRPHLQVAIPTNGIERPSLSGRLAPPTTGGRSSISSNSTVH